MAVSDKHTSLQHFIVVKVFIIIKVLPAASTLVLYLGVSQEIKSTTRLRLGKLKHEP
jgi:hypothetical protein